MLLGRSAWLACFCGAMFSVTILFQGCGPSLKYVQPERTVKKLHVSRILLLPVQAKNEMQRERVQTVEKLLESALSNRGYSVMGPDSYRTLCEDNCRLVDFARKYHLDAVARMKLSSSAKDNFLAGHYTSVSGELDLESPEGVSLLEVRHTESERGGLLFNTGQIFQGLISQAEYSDKVNFEDVVSRFSEAIVAKLPNPAYNQAGVVPDLHISKVEVSRSSKSLVEVCVNGTPHVFAWLIQGRLRSSLQEIKAGVYCGKYREEQLELTPNRLEVEIMSVYGQSNKQEVSFVSEI